MSVMVKQLSVALSALQRFDESGPGTHSLQLWTSWDGGATLTAIGCSESEGVSRMQDIDVSDVKKLLDEFAAAYSAKDADAALAAISSEADCVLVGTGADEVRIGPDQVREQIERDFSQADEIALELGPVRVSTRGEVAWAFAEPTVVATIDGIAHRMPVRLTAVLVVQDGRLLIHSGHLSVAFAAQESGQSFADA